MLFFFNLITEVHVINETEEYLKGLINDFGLRLHSTATCTKLRCIKYGPFTVDHALLKKHWGVESLINNSLLTKKILKSLNMNRRDPLITADSIDLKPTTVAESASLS
jgi:tRNA U55 pseudouridine synthase TruB